MSRNFVKSFLPIVHLQLTSAVGTCFCTSILALASRRVWELGNGQCSISARSRRFFSHEQASQSNSELRCIFPARVTMTTLKGEVCERLYRTCYIKHTSFHDGIRYTKEVQRGCTTSHEECNSSETFCITRGAYARCATRASNRRAFGSYLSRSGELCGVRFLRPNLRAQTYLRVPDLGRELQSTTLSQPPHPPLD